MCSTKKTYTMFQYKVKLHFQIKVLYSAYHSCCNSSVSSVTIAQMDRVWFPKGNLDFSLQHNNQHDCAHLFFYQVALSRHKTDKGMNLSLHDASL
jgi:hypothetical protein